MERQDLYILTNSLYQNKTGNFDERVNQGFDILQAGLDIDLEQEEQPIRKFDNKDDENVYKQCLAVASGILRGTIKQKQIEEIISEKPKKTKKGRKKKSAYSQ
jgi:hypothetical protein